MSQEMLISGPFGELPMKKFSATDLGQEIFAEVERKTAEDTKAERSYQLAKALCSRGLGIRFEGLDLKD